MLFTMAVSLYTSRIGKNLVCHSSPLDTFEVIECNYGSTIACFYNIYETLNEDKHKNKSLNIIRYEGYSISRW